MKYLAFAFVLALAACGTDTFSTDDAGGPPPAEAGMDTAALPPGCDLTKDPKDSPACVADGVGLFVSIHGADTNPGTKESPLATIDAALAKMPSRIYVCAGDYTSSATIAGPNPVSIYGGFDCASWTYGATNRPRIAGSLGVKSTHDVTLEDLEVDAPDRASTSGLSSVALTVSGALAVRLTRLKLVGGQGGSGPDGTLASYTFPPTLQGNSSASGAAAATQKCPDGSTSVGGKGAVYVAMIDNHGDNGTPGGSPNGGSSIACDTSGTGGGNGSVGPNASNAAGATRLGSLAPDGWTPAPGTDGPAGSPGQGGGGGSAGFASMKTPGSGGGAGGCGGAGGSAGKGGGASIGLLDVASLVTIRESVITAKNAGNGGNGVGGQAGQKFSGGGGAPTAPACAGGTGGYGGDGGAGGGGVGGVSAAIFFKGTTPDMDGFSQTGLLVGNFGLKGGGPAPVSDGIDGSATALLECKAPMCQ